MKTTPWGDFSHLATHARPTPHDCHGAAQPWRGCRHPGASRPAASRPWRRGMSLALSSVDATAGLLLLRAPACQRDVAHTRLDELCEFAPHGRRRRGGRLHGSSASSRGSALCPGQRIEPKLPLPRDPRSLAEPRVARALRVRPRSDRFSAGSTWSACSPTAAFPTASTSGCRQGVVLRSRPSHRLQDARRGADPTPRLRTAAIGPGSLTPARSAALSVARSLEATLAITRALSEALQDLGHQLIAQAHSPSVRSLAQGERSPYRGLYEAQCALDESPAGRGRGQRRSRAPAAVHPSPCGATGRSWSTAERS